VGLAGAATIVLAPGLEVAVGAVFAGAGCKSSASPDFSPDGSSAFPRGDGDADTSRSLDGGPNVLDCDAGLSPCDGECVDLTKDPLNCGACVHGCLGAPCSGGLCEPVVLASGQADPGALVLDDSYVYFTNVSAGDAGAAGSVARVPKLGGPTSTLAAAQIAPSSLALDANYLYWSSRAAGTGALFKCPLAGCTTATAVPIATGLDAPDGVVLDATNVYFTTAVAAAPTGDAGDAGAGPVTGTVSVVGKDGKNKRDVIAGQSAPSGLAVDDAHVFFSTRVAAGGIVRCPLTGPCSNPLTLAPPQGLPAQIVLDGTTAFWANNGGSLGRVDKTGDGYREIVAGGAPTRLAIDATTVYWTDGPGKSVKRATKDGQRVAVIAVDQDDPLAIAIDGTAVYWTNRGGQVMRLAK